MAAVASPPAPRLRIVFRGAVQGVGFRPFLYRLATELDLAGWVRNGPAGVICEVEGTDDAVRAFLRRIPGELPPRAAIHGMEPTFLDPAGARPACAFVIQESDTAGPPAATVLPDIATCADCLREIFDPADRRYRYPFANCTNCGPRYSILESLPYDRARTTLKRFALCDRCQSEFDDPDDRRFHAQPTACPFCGPHLELWTPAGTVSATQDAALRAAARAIRAGAIVAVQGVGGFHLMVDARAEHAVRLLRERKGREDKPFAVMYPSLARLDADARPARLEALLLTSPEAPIVLVRRASDGLASSVAPGNPSLGVLLPANPLHHLLASELGFPVVATSGNRAEEPICTDRHEALERLGGIADLFLVHDRPIARPIDDSIVRLVADRPLVLRRARGFAPLPIAMRQRSGPGCPALALGAQQKSAVAISVGQDAVLSQHLGDLGSAPASENFRKAIGDLSALYAHTPEVVASDLHPDYRSTRSAAALGLPLVGVQHHYAHVLSCMTENEIDPPVLGVAWDGTGWGTDGTVWGGEFLRVPLRGFERVGHLRTFGLPGSEKAVIEPRRAALGVLFEIYGAELPDDLAPVRAWSPRDRATLVAMMEKGLNTPRTSSAGRLFDAVAALVGIRQTCTFEGQAAMELEWSIEERDGADRYDVAAENWEPIVRGIVGDLRRGVPVGRIAGRFHNSLTEMIVQVATRVGEEKVALSGGCFQNRTLVERTVGTLRAAGFRPYWHQRVPPNDGGIALGQLAALARG